MTNEEAIIDIRENIQPIVGGKSLDIAISAIEKQIPKKPNEIIVIDRKSFACPRCNELLHSYLQSYCADCGQALKWSDIE